MTFEEILDQAIAMLQRRGRLTYSTLKRQFRLDDAALEDLKNELIEGQRLAVDEQGNVLVWTGAEGAAPHLTALSASSQDRPPLAYTPRYLAEKILTSKSALEGERKQVTVLFADLKGSMELLADRDPEEARQLLDPVLERMMEAVHRYEGTVNQVMGDGIMALFGAPLAHEDHAVRACYAALRMQETVRRYAEDMQRAYGVPVQIRVGLNAGEVVVRSIDSDLHMDYSAIGQTTHLAARMEQMARPGSVLTTAEILKLVEGYVYVKPLGPVSIRGLEAPIAVYEIVGAGPVRSRLQVAAARGLTRFVGRDAEMEQLQRALEQAREGHGQVVAVVGEVGVGKSRLFFEFTRSHRTQAWLIIESSTVSYGKATSYLPVIELLKGYFQIEDRDTTQRIREKVTGKIFTLDERLKEAIPPLLSLLGALPEDDPIRSLNPPHRRSLVLVALKQLLLRESQRQPLLLVFEDLHWIDTESQAALDTLVESLPTSRVLLLTNYRPEYDDHWTSKTYYTRLRVDPLPPQEADALLEALLGDARSLGPLKARLKARTGGNPFFLEECVRTLVEMGALGGQRGAYRLERDVHTLQIPATVHALLAARIDRLPAEEKQLLQSAAVIGTDVPLVLLQAITELSEDDLRGGLAHVQAAEFLYETRLFPDPEYTFKHALTHDVAYGSLLHERRRMLHQRVGEAIEARYADRLAEFSETLASHFERGEAWAKAVRYYLRAAEKAKEHYTYQSAMRFCTQALELAAKAHNLDEERMRGLVLLGDLWSLLGDAEHANQSYDQALVASADSTVQRWISNKRHRQHTAIRDGARIAFYEHGSGDVTLVFVVPGAYTVASYEPVLDRLCQEFRIIRIDQRGTGASDPRPRSYTRKEYAEDIRAVIEASGAGSIVGVGMSRGGTWMVTLATTYPLLVQKLVLVGSHAAPSVMYAQLDWVDEVRELLRQGQKERALRLLAAIGLPEPGTEHLVEQFVQVRLSVPTDALLNFYDPDPEVDIVALLPQIQVPTLVMHGTADRRVPIEAGRYLAEHIPGAWFYALQGKGHVPAFTATSEFCEVLRCFIRTGTIPQTTPGSG
jgi:class 3 adenylate cyclase/pimeloyl-ACP methyl ester carboxylesterase